MVTPGDLNRFTPTMTAAPDRPIAAFTGRMQNPATPQTHQFSGRMHNPGQRAPFSNLNFAQHLQSFTPLLGLGIGDGSLQNGMQSFDPQAYFNAIRQY